ncbi:bacillithiol biosynthesis cysteine-adding enzyme BshC [Sphingobacterium sp. lm-10]|uniref:bacillithiol biosynthesis cysteine-adding enzyme BshC n=1 Tax=Sphingobacterium sp. lm-10 TaxID=2944904 RepID=UPI002021DCB2|nr:bacillithiol biosynthesis cysteine-adding enzyme BshC [Sphingobacterium sp. lm-10]MCL7988250.1 bacillithiol biosynthesis cysteine-adding enzyme BshC [Sphingobacterium sp. lm-10]
MKATYIDYKDTNSFSKTLLAYLAGDEALSPFYGHYPTLENFGKQIESKSAFSLDQRTVLVQELRKQYDGLLEDAPEVRQQIDSLQDPQTFTVVTGHQLNIFTGPLYFIFKIVSAIRLAQDLNKAYPDQHVVPVYWMATEDHDFEEINHTRVHGKKVSWDRPSLAATGRMPTEDMVDVVRQYIGMLGLNGHSADLATLVEDAYLSGLPLADATRKLVHQLFKKYGLIIIDADRPSFKRQFSDIIAKDILSEASFRAIEHTSSLLNERGYATQVNAREVNFFYLTDTFRERLVRTYDGRFEVLHRNIFFTEEELLQEIANYPERFSPNVVMRPLYQELILPNLAYIGGGAEIVYWLQLKANFDQYQLPFPILVPRNSAIVTDDAVVGKIFRLDLTLKSIFKPLDVLKNEYVRRYTKHRLTLRDEWMELNAIFGKMKLRTHKIDPSLGPSTEAVKARLKKAINSLEKKLLKSDKRNHQEGLIQIERVKDRLFPGGGLQERSENFATLYVKYGDVLIADLVTYFNPLDFKFTILY